MNFLSDFGVQPILLAAQVVNFFILFFILKKFLYGPILKVLAERRKKIEDSLKNAEEIEKRLLETEEQKEKILAKASEQAQKIVDEAKKAGVLIVEEAHQKAFKDAENIIKKAVEAGRMEVERMISEARSQLLDLVIAVISKVSGKVFTKDDQKKIIQQEIKHLS
ncbi:MAG: F0F1 ATP synthase subunit B [Patescibacteria group bacterium]